MTEQELMQEALEWREHIAKLAADYSDQELFRKRLATIEWLIEKAELAIELEEEIEKWRKVKDATVKLAKENERYKEALERIASEKEVSEGDHDADIVANKLIYRAQEALEGED